MDLDEDINWNQCICHKDGESHDYQPLTQITETSWLTLTNAALVRKDHVYDKLQSYFKGEPRGCYYRNCYQWYTHKQKLERLKRKRELQNEVPADTDDSSRTTKSRRSAVPRTKLVQCVICQTSKTSKSPGVRYEPLTSLETMTASENLLQAAKIRRDHRVSLAIEGQDLVAIEVKYHRSCYREYTRKRNLENLARYNAEEESTSGYRTEYERAFNVLSKYIEEKIILDQEIITMSTLRDRYEELLVEEGLADEVKSYRTEKLKTRIIKMFGEQVGFWHPRNRSKSEIIYSELLPKGQIIEEGIGNQQISEESDIDFENDFEKEDNQAKHLYHSAKLLRSIVTDKKYTVPWPPVPDDLTENNIVIPDLLYNFLAWLLSDDNSTDPVSAQKVLVSEKTHHKILSLGQDFMFNASNGRIKTPKHIALPMTIKSKTGCAEIVTLLNRLGHGISYTHIEELETAMAMRQVKRYEDGSVLPSNAQPGVFATFCWDNNDLKEETLSGKGTTHCTNGIMIQPKVQGCQERPLMATAEARSKHRAFKMPPIEINFFPSGKRLGPPPINLSEIELQRSTHILSPHSFKDNGWMLCRLNPSADIFTPNQEESQQIAAWTAFNVNISQDDGISESIVGYCQVIDSSPTEMPTVYTVLKRSIQMADQLGQQDVIIVFDQAIYAKANEIIWRCQEEMNRVVLRMGAFHIACTFLAVIGKRFGDAGLEDLIVEAEIVASGSVKKVFEGKHYNRAMRMHKIVYEALWRLRWVVIGKQLTLQNASDFNGERAVNLVKAVRDDPSQENFSKLLAHQDIHTLFTYELSFSGEELGPMAVFWSSYLRMVNVLLCFIRSTREGIWDLHLACIREMLPWMFAYDRTNYARYLSYYWMDMKSLQMSHPEADTHLQNGEFAVQRTAYKGFSRVAVDHTIEQTVNRDTKTKGGIIGFSLKKGTVQRWILTAHEHAEIVGNMRSMVSSQELVLLHKEDTKKRKSRDEADVRKTQSILKSWGNPFSSSDDLCCLSSGITATETVASDIKNAEINGEKAAVEFMKKRILSNEVDFFAALSRQDLKTFSSMKKSTKIKVSGKEEILKADRNLFARMTVIAQTRSMDMQEVLKHPLGPLPWSLASTDGTIAKTVKSKLAELVEKNVASLDEEPRASQWILDAMALLQSLTHIPDSFSDLAELVFNKVLHTAKRASRIDFVSDLYPEISIKNTERSKRAKGGTIRIKITGGTQKCPTQWKKFLSDGRNKTALIGCFLKEWTSDKYARKLGEKIIVLNVEEKCYKLQASNEKVLATALPELDSNQEEADTRIFLHAFHGAQNGHSSIIVKSSDTDVEVLALYYRFDIHSRLYILSGTSKRSRIIDVSAVTENLGEDMCRALPGLHAFSGCDSVSAFVGKGKKKAFDLLYLNQELFLQGMQQLGNSHSISEELQDSCEAFTCALYGGAVNSINEVRYRLFCSKSLQSHQLPPCQDTLNKHIQRANYQASIWKTALEAYSDIPSPVGHGWFIDGSDIMIDWMDALPAPLAVLELLSCRCTTKCSNNRCACFQNKLQCTDACGCDKNTCENQIIQSETDDENDTDNESASDEE